ncbi:MAG: energy transducer TonB [Acidobacteriota bacterium]
MKHLTNSRWLFIGPVIFATILTLSVQAPSQRREPTRTYDDDDINQRSFNLRMLHIMGKQKKPRRAPELALAQLQDDFTHLQLVNKRLGLAALGDAALDLKFVTRAATEINKRAERLKENLALPLSAEPAEPHKQYIVDNPGKLKEPIVELARLVVDFTDNPFFKEASVLETVNATVAQHDLERIIRLSEEIRHFSKSLGNGQESTQSTIQTDKKIRDPEKIAVEALRRREVPEATLPSTPAEAEWWERVRKESIRVQKSYDRGSDKLVRLLKEGADNGFRVPIPDRGVTFLRRSPPRYSDEAKDLKISGGMALVAEFLADGTVGEVKIVEGLPAGLNENAIEATHKTVFLPAVKDAKFVSSRLPMTMSFNAYQR